MQLMSYDEYVKTRWNFPYYYSLRTAENVLYYFGEKHSYDPRDPQKEVLKKFWSDFLDETKDKKRIFFIEGGIRPVDKDLDKSEDEIISQYGTLGFGTCLAYRAGVDVISPEPSRLAALKELQKEFSQDEIMYYYFAHAVRQLSLEGKKGSFEKDLCSWIGHFREEFGWDDSFSLERMKELHETFFNEPFSEENEEFFIKAMNPVRLTYFTNSISRKVSEVRDQYILSQISEYLNNGYSVFIQYGGSHAIVQEAVLREVFSAA